MKNDEQMERDGYTWVEDAGGWSTGHWVKRSEHGSVWKIVRGVLIIAALVALAGVVARFIWTGAA